MKENKRRREKPVMRLQKTEKWVSAVAITLILVVSGCGLTDSNKSPVKEKPVPTNQETEKLTHLTVCWECSDYNGEQTGWFADLLQERFGVRIDIEPNTLLDDYEKEADIILFNNIYAIDYQKMLHEGNIAKSVVSNNSYAKVMAVNANSKNIEICEEILDYLNSVEGMMVTLYGPKGVCWDYQDGKVKLTDLGKQALKEGNTTIIPSDISEEDTYMSGCSKLCYQPYDWEDIDPNTGEAFNTAYYQTGVMEQEKGGKEYYAKGAGENSTIFTYNDKSIDVSNKAKGKKIVAIQDYQTDKKSILLECRTSENHEMYLVLDKKSMKVIRELDGYCYTRLGNTIDTGQYVNETGVYDYDGKCIRKISLSETEYVMNIYNVNDERGMVNIADWKSGKIRSIDI